ncbi:DUF4350 domain-containing protein [Catenovulum adriaticum]|uniref:DUF4350 domain-containing protein n=1 Tax=Catenovulum adriaticum TaxID=2984846 RepID=A0ABY7ARL2_9ALTE|nr:DUF4350 domain-containing protein [Catenovulum sp. TS8]WAJ72185.1 DUF4350 domain-containing protein [Catenovulum sp. TS8]
MQVKQLVRTGVVVILLILISTCSYYNWQWKETEVNIGIADNLMQQPFLALQKLSESTEGSLKVVYDYPRLFSNAKSKIVPAHDAVLILTSSDKRLTQNQSQQIVAWVEQGGHLIFSMDTAFYKQPRDIHHPLWNTLNITAIPPKTIEPTESDDLTSDSSPSEQADSQEENEKAAIEPEDEAEEAEKAPEKLEFEGPFSTEFKTQNGNVFFAYLEKSYRISAPENAQVVTSAGDEQGDTFVQIKLGQGKVSLLTEIEIWNNRQLNSAHNAYLYRWLVDDRQNIWLFTSAAQDHWLVSLANWSPSLIVLILVLLVLFVWYQAVQFGPAYTHNETHQHFFHQHIKASAEFYWQHKQQALLTNALQQQVIEKICKRWPAFRTANQAQQIDYLVDLTQLDKTLIQKSIFAHTNQDERGFTRQVRTLQKIRNLI